tara:strand:+ start:6106 stop:8520 length:2415 start_codon:yes stop_codon:yes gene_type:complete
MKVYTNTNSSFPSQVVPDAEKQTEEYGLQVSRAIEQEWFGSVSGNRGRFQSGHTNYHQLRLYARGDQSIQKYKDELAINGDLSYLNLDWKPVPVIPKFVDIVVNGISEKKYDIKAVAQDPESIKKKTNYASALMGDVLNKDNIVKAGEMFGTNFFKTNIPTEDLPETIEEVELHMQLSYKQSIEIAEEEAIKHVLAFNKWETIKRRLNYDLTVLGIGAVKTNFNASEGITISYVDPAYLVYSYTEDPNFDDIYYVGEVKAITIPELKKQFPNITEEELYKIQQMPGNRQQIQGLGDYDENTVQVLYFEYKTYMNQVFKIKYSENGMEKVLEKTDEFNPPISDKFERLSRTIEVLYSGAKVLGTNTMLQWELSENMTRPFADTTKVKMNYNICAPRMYKGRVESLVSRITGFADMIQLTHLKLQQVLSRIVPDGIFLDMDGLAEVDLGNGTNYNPAEALNMYFQTGSIVGRSLTQDGGMNPGKVPVQELASSSGQGKIQSLIGTYQYYLQMIRDVTGLNEARDGSAPDKDALVGIQKMAANASNTATRHIEQASELLALKTCENTSLKLADIVANPLTRNSLMNSISTFNVATIEEIQHLNLHDFGIYLELEPEEEEKAQLEQNMQMALQSGSIDLDDIIDIRQVKNMTLANQMIKLKKKKKQEAAQAIQLQNIQAQSQASAQAAESAAMNEVQKQQALTAEKVAIEQAKAQFEINRMQTEVQLKMQLMQIEFEYNMQLSQARSSETEKKSQTSEDRKDDRERLRGTQQSEIADQKQNNLPPKNFESAGNDILGGGFGLGDFGPR